MALVAFASAKGSPGVSIGVAALASVWPREAVVADCDPAGGDVALRFRGEDGDPLDTAVGLLSLGAAVRAGGATDLTSHLQTTRSGTRVLAGVSSPEQVHGLGAAWQHIALTLGRSGTDVLADVGRLTPGSPAMPVVEHADSVVLVTGPTLEEIAHVRERARSLTRALNLGSFEATPTGVVLVTDASDARGAADLERLLAASGLPIRGLGILARDRKAAEAIRTESARSLHRTDLIRSAHDLAARIDDLTMLTGRAPSHAR